MTHYNLFLPFYVHEVFCTLYEIIIWSHIICGGKSDEGTH